MINKNLTVLEKRFYSDSQEFQTSLSRTMATTQLVRSIPAFACGIFVYARSAENKIFISNNPSRFLDRRLKLLAPIVLVQFVIFKQQIKKIIMSNTKGLKTVQFNNHNIKIIEYKGQQYISGPDIERSLEYQKQGKVAEIYNRYKDEFDPEMSIILDTPDLGVSRKSSNCNFQTISDSDLKLRKNNLRCNIRYYNRRGAYLIAMLSRTKTAKNFRKWVLDILENKTVADLTANQKPEFLTPAGFKIYNKKQSDTLIFNKTPLETVTINNEEWITSFSLAKLLNYRDLPSINNLYYNNKDKFNSLLAQKVNSISISRKNEPFIVPVRVFSLLGAHLMISLTKMPNSKEIQNWLLEKIESSINQNKKEPPFDISSSLNELRDNIDNIEYRYYKKMCELKGNEKIKDQINKSND